MWQQLNKRQLNLKHRDIQTHVHRTGHTGFKWTTGKLNSPFNLQMLPIKLRTCKEPKLVRNALAINNNYQNWPLVSMPTSWTPKCTSLKHLSNYINTFLIIYIQKKAFSIYIDSTKWLKLVWIHNWPVSFDPLTIGQTNGLLWTLFDPRQKRRTSETLVGFIFFLFLFCFVLFFRKTKFALGQRKRSPWTVFESWPRPTYYHCQF